MNEELYEKIDSQEAIIESLEAMITELNEEVRILSAERDTLSMEDMKRVWDNAEQAETCYPGDLLISLSQDGTYKVYRAIVEAELRSVRILSRNNGEIIINTKLF